MENRQQQILSEIQSMMASIRVQLEKLDVKIAEFQQVVDIEGVEAAPIDLEIDELYFAEEQVTDMELDLPEAVAEPVAEPVVAPEPVVEETEPEPVVEQTVEVEVVEPDPEPMVEPEEVVEVKEQVVEDDDDLPLFGEPESIFEAAQKSPRARKTVVDVMEDKQAWRTDMPGAPVKDLLSAISLNDRVQFINVLFKEDPAAFQQARARINAMETLDEVVEFVASEYDWDMNSPVVYRFMMAVRRKVK